MEQNTPENKSSCQLPGKEACFKTDFKLRHRREYLKQADAVRCGKFPLILAALCFIVILRTSSGKIKVNDIKVWTYFGNQSHESVRERQKRARKVSPNPITREHFRALDQSTAGNFANQKLIFLLQNSHLDRPHSSIILPAEMLFAFNAYSSLV